MSAIATRRELLTTGAAAGAGAAAAALLAAGFPGSAGAVTAPERPESTATRVVRLLRIELLMLFCYQHVLDSPVLTPRAQQMLTPLRVHEEAHVSVLSTRLTALGATVPAPPGDVAAANRDLARRGVVGRLGQLQGSHDALHLLLDLERVVIGVYFVALTKLSDPQLVTLAAQIMAAEAQNEALLGEVLNPGSAQKAVPYGLVQGVQ